MTVGPEDFFKRIEESGLLNDSIVEQKDRLRAADSAEDAAADLVSQKLLTAYQSEVLLSGEDVPLVLGDYVVTESIGRGGMGYVLKARHRRMKRTVAIKFLLKSLTDSDDLRRRFEREVEAAAQLDHQNIVTAYDAGVHEGSHYLVMQYVNGEDLSQIVKSSGPMDIPDAVDVIRQAALGLGYAHDRGIIHRDIKPGNLLLDSDGVVRILDMGLARMMPSPGDELEGGAHADLTNTGSVMGTIDYMAPEQALDAKSVDHRADIYALGCTLYFLLTSNPPYRNDTVMRRLLAHREEPVPKISAYRPETPTELDGIFAKMMAKSPDNRYGSMKQLVNDLDALDVGDAGAEQIATLDMPDNGNGGFISLPEDDSFEAGNSENTVVTPERTVTQSAASFGSIESTVPSESVSSLERSTLEPSPTDVTMVESRNEQDASNAPETVFDSRSGTAITITGKAADPVPPRGPLSTIKLIVAAGLAVACLIVFLVTRSDESADSVNESVAATLPTPDQPALEAGRSDAGTDVSSQPADQSPDQRAAEWVFSIGGRLIVETDQNPYLQVDTRDELPADGFRIINVVLSDCGLADDQGMQNLCGVSSLVSLSISHTDISDEGLAEMTRQGQDSFPALRQIVANDSRINGQGLRFLTESRGFDYLAAGRTQFNDLSVLEVFPELGHLAIDGCPVRPADLGRLSRFTKLASLGLDGKQASEGGLESVALVGSLEILQIVGVDAGFDVKPLAELPRLSRLVLTHVPDRCFQGTFWEDIARIEQLAELRLEKCLDDETLSGIRPMPRLQALHLTGTGIRGRTLKQSLGRLPMLETLSLNYSQISDSELSGLQSLSRLSALDIRYNDGVSLAGVEALRKTLPNCRIESDHGTFESTKSE